MSGTTGIDGWRKRVQDFQRDCEEGAADTEPQRLREATGILFGEPMQLSGVFRGDRTVVDGLIERSAFESAALAIIGDRTAFMLSRSCDGRCLATIADHGVEATAEGASLALALLAAYAGALLTWASGHAPPLPDAALPDPAARFH